MHMNEPNLVELAAFVAFSLFVVILRLFWGLHVDYLREKLFALRDEMMLYAYDNGLVGNLAYRNLRILMNGLIRYSHRLSFAKLMLMSLGRRRFGIPLTPPTEFVEWRSAVSALPEDQRKRFEEFHQSAVLFVTTYMVLRSPLVWTMALGVLAHLVLIKPTRMLWIRMVEALQPKLHLDLALAEALKAART